MFGDSMCCSEQVVKACRSRPDSLLPAFCVLLPFLGFFLPWLFLCSSHVWKPGGGVVPYIGYTGMCR